MTRKAAAVFSAPLQRAEELKCLEASADDSFFSPGSFFWPSFELSLFFHILLETETLELVLPVRQGKSTAVPSPPADVGGSKWSLHCPAGIGCAEILHTQL